MAGGKTSSQPVQKADFNAIEAAVMETARGRWFLAEYARRNRAADTAAVLEALARLEAKLAATKQQPAAAAVPFAEPLPTSREPAPQREAMQETAVAAPTELPRIPEPDFSAVEQLFHGKQALDWPEPALPLVATPTPYDDEPWPPEADDPPAAIVSSDADQGEDPEVEEEDIEAWEAELHEMEQPAAAAAPEQPEEFSFFRKVAAGDGWGEQTSAVIEPPRRLASAAAEWPAARAVEARAAFSEPEIARPALAEIPQPAPLPPIARPEPSHPALPAFEGPSPIGTTTPPLSERVQLPRPAASLVARAQTVSSAASLMSRPDPERPLPAPAPKTERKASRPTPRLDDPTIAMTRDEKLAMFS